MQSDRTLELKFSCVNNFRLFKLSFAEKDPYPVDALPTCNHALSVCQQERKCIKLFEDFKTHCKVRENKCRMEDRLVDELNYAVQMGKFSLIVSPARD